MLRKILHPGTRLERFWEGVAILTGRVFKPAARYPSDPRAVFILALSVFSGLTAIALDAGPQTLNALLPKAGVILWGCLLTFGSALTLYGMKNQTGNGIILEQIGSVIVGATTVFYSGLAFWVIGLDAIQVIGIILAWGLACFIRWGQLQALLNQNYADRLEVSIETEVKRRLDLEEF